jgi:hypothetical protein
MRDVDVQINVPPLLRNNAQTIALSVMFVSACPSLKENISGIRERSLFTGWPPAAATISYDVPPCLRAAPRSRAADQEN